MRWNEPATWKDAWTGAADGWLCFAETGWGDQFAYEARSAAAPCYRLDAFSMEPEPVASGFAEWLRRVFLPACAAPRDDLTVAVRERLGRLPVSEHVAFLPAAAGASWTRGRRADARGRRHARSRDGPRSGPSAEAPRVARPAAAIVRSSHDPAISDVTMDSITSTA